MRSLAQRLIAEERRNGNDSDEGSRAAFRVCEKLRRPLSTFAGAAGFRSLFSRALVLAKVESPLLEGVQIQPDGSFGYAAELEAQLATEDAARAGAALADQLLGLLVTFIGEALTLRLVHDVWPKAALKDSKPGGKSL
ncbi:MAG: hypothetical protein JWM88_2384 [Verrucomicrobia bacterium]|nr:hypothetical protein [Verrucomicrobiota bacterium]